MDSDDRTPTGICTNLELCGGIPQLRQWFSDLSMAEVVSLGLDQGYFALVRASGSRSLRAIEKHTRVLPPEGIADVPVLLEAVLTLRGVTVVVVAGDAHPGNPLLVQLVDEACALIPSNQTHLVLQTWREPSRTIYIRLTPSGPLRALRPGGLYNYPRLVAGEGGKVGLLAFMGPTLYFFPDVTAASGKIPVHQFENQVLGVSRVTPRTIGGIEFVVTTEAGMERMLFKPVGVRTAAIQKASPTGFTVRGTIPNGDHPLVIASNLDGDLVLGRPDWGFVSERIAG